MPGLRLHLRHLYGAPPQPVPDLQPLRLPIQRHLLCFLPAGRLLFELDRQFVLRVRSELQMYFWFVKLQPALGLRPKTARSATMGRTLKRQLQLA